MILVGLVCIGWDLLLCGTFWEWGSSRRWSWWLCGLYSTRFWRDGRCARRSSPSSRPGYPRTGRCTRCSSASSGRVFPNSNHKYLRTVLSIDLLPLATFQIETPEIRQSHFAIGSAKQPYVSFVYSQIEVRSPFRLITLPSLVNHLPFLQLEVKRIHVRHISGLFRDISAVDVHFAL